MCEGAHAFDRYAVALEEIAVVPYRVPALPATQGTPVGVGRDRDPIVEGWLVGAVGGRARGWWGPVDEATARGAQRLFRAVDERSPASPGGWADRLRRSVRHAHSGILALSVGAVELACWDLCGRLEGRPVWALIGGERRLDHVPAYATCFGVDLLAEGAATLAASLADSWPFQKWKAPVLSPERIATVAEAIGPLARHGIALDFHGRADPEHVKALCRALADPLAFVEEPCAPHDLHRRVPGEFGAPHAAGEHCYGPADAVLLEAAGVDIWQPDAVFCGGLEALAELAARCAAAGARFMPHGGGLLPALHLAAAGAPVEAVEYHLELELRRQAHLQSPALADAGLVPVSSEPGWGGPLRTDLDARC